MYGDKTVKEFLGTGWKFPVGTDQVTGRILMESGEEDIREAIGIILMTGKGERMMRPDFGCGIRELLFETAEPFNLIRIQQEIEKALTLCEPRITEVSVQVSEDGSREGLLNISIHYVVRSTNSPYNLVYPYYINEGFGEA